MTMDVESVLKLIEGYVDEKNKAQPTGWDIFSIFVILAFLIEKHPDREELQSMARSLAAGLEDSPSDAPYLKQFITMLDVM